MGKMHLCFLSPCAGHLWCRSVRAFFQGKKNTHAALGVKKKNIDWSFCFLFWGVAKKWSVTPFLCPRSTDSATAAPQGRVFQPAREVSHHWIRSIWRRIQTIKSWKYGNMEILKKNYIKMPPYQKHQKAEMLNYWNPENKKRKNMDDAIVSPFRRCACTAPCFVHTGSTQTYGFNTNCHSPYVQWPCLLQPGLIRTHCH